MAINLERFHGRLFDRRAFLQGAGAAAAGLLLPDFLPDFLKFPERPFINGSGIDQFCIQNPDLCVRTTYTDTSRGQHEIIFLETGAFGQFLLDSREQGDSCNSTIFRAMNGKYSPVVPERDNEYFSNVYLASTKINEPEDTLHGLHQITHGAFVPEKLYCIYEEIPRNQRPLNWKKMTPEELIAELNNGSPYELRSDFYRDTFLIDNIKDIRKAIETETLGQHLDLINDYLWTLVDYLKTNFTFIKNYGGTDPEEVLNLLINRVPKIGDCSEIARALALFSYWQFPELFDEDSIFFVSVRWPSKTEKGNVTSIGHAFDILAPNILTDDGRQPYFLVDNGALVSFYEKDPNKTFFGPYYSLGEIKDAIWKETGLRNNDIGWMILSRFTDPEQSLYSPVTATGSDTVFDNTFTENGKAFRNQVSADYYKDLHESIPERGDLPLRSVPICASPLPIGIVGLAALTSVAINRRQK